jgi:hypothetical protein
MDSGGRIEWKDRDGDVCRTNFDGTRPERVIGTMFFE